MPGGTVQKVPARWERALDASTSFATRSFADRLARAVSVVCAPPVMIQPVAGLATVAFALGDLSVAAPLVRLMALVGWARVRLGRHTPRQVAAGRLSALPILWYVWPI